MDTLKEQKNQLRKKHLSIRNLMDVDHVKIYSGIICDKILLSKEYKDAKQVLCYYPLGNEVDILKVAKDCFKNNKTVCFPKVMSKTNIEFYQVESLNDFKKGSFKVMEPLSVNKAIMDTKTLILLPGLAFDYNSYRLGYGGGYYDRYLEQMNLSLTDTFGVCFSWQLIDSVPRDDFDKKLNCIINEH